MYPEEIVRPMKLELTESGFNDLKTKEDVFIELRDQLTESVRWERCVQQIQKMDAEMVFEVGPGSVLTKLVRRIDKTQKVVSLSDPLNGLLSENFSSVEATAR